MPAIDFKDYASPEADKLLAVRFYNDAVQNKHTSALEKRPIFDDVEMLEILIPADRSRSLVVPALAEWKRFGNRAVTYAERFGEHYKRFKANEHPIVNGTPLSELVFLSVAQRKSLQALDVYTAEQLASLQGQQLKNIGAGGMGMQQAAAAYLAKAAGATEKDIELDKLRQEVADLRAAMIRGDAPLPAGNHPSDDYASMRAEALKEHIALKVGRKPQGNPSHATLVSMAQDLDREAAASAA